MAKEAVQLAECIAWIVENTDLTWAQKFQSAPPEAKMCAQLFGMSELYFAGLLLEKKNGIVRDENGERIRWPRAPQESLSSKLKH